VGGGWVIAPFILNLDTMWAWMIRYKCFKKSYISFCCRDLNPGLSKL
jgi:hypothetical protein